MESKPPKQYKLLAKGILEYLECLRNDAANDKDAEMREDDDSMDDSEDEEGSESDGLIDDRNDNEIVPEAERPERARPGFRKPYVKKRKPGNSSSGGVSRPRIAGSKPDKTSSSHGIGDKKRDKKVVEKRCIVKEEPSKDNDDGVSKLQALKERIAMKNGGMMTKE